MKISTALASAIAAINGATKIDWAGSFCAVMNGGARRVVVKRDAAAGADPWVTGTAFRDAAIGAFTYDGLTGRIYAGKTNNVTIKLATTLATGSAVVRITNSADTTLWLECTYGLTGSGKEATVTADPTATGGFGFAGGFYFLPPAGLPLGGSGVLATFSIANTSTSLVAADFIPPMYGHPFKKGDIPIGAYPKFETAGASACPYTMFGKTTWSDGSLKFASFLIRVPATVAASGNIAIKVKTTTAAPASASSRTLADLSSGSTDLNVTVTGLDNLTGTWVSSLNQGITDADDILVYGDGAVGKVWRVRQQFMSAGANHGQLECYWYVAALQDASGALYGIRHLGRVVQPWFDVDTPAKTYRSFASFLVKNGAATIRNGWANHGTPQAFSYPVTPTFSGSDKYLATPSLQFESQTLVKLSGTTLPTGLSSGTSYFVAKGDFANMVMLSTDASMTGPAFSGTASGDCQMTGYPYLTHFGSLWTCGPTAKWDYLQAGGTVVADATVRVQHDSVYWQSSGMVPTYESFTPSVQNSYSYELGTMGPVQRAVHTTGERDDIGVLPSWYVKHLISQRAVDEQVVRVCGLAQGHAAVSVYSSATKTIKPLNAGTYAGMPASSSTFRWAGNFTYTQGFTGPTGVATTGFDALSFDHMPCLSSYAYMMTGEPQYLDVLIEMANMSISYGYTGFSTATAQLLSAERNATINGTNYAGVVTMAGEARTSAWAARDIAFAAALVPDAAAQCASYKAYFSDLNTANYAAMKDYTDNVAPAEWRTFGQMQFNSQPIMSPWMLGYLIQAMAQAVRMTESAPGLYMLSHASKWFGSVYAAHGAWHTTAYRAIVRSALSGGALPASMNAVSYYSFSTAWATGANTFTNSVAPEGYTLANGDVLMWDGQEVSVPAGLTACAPYYVVNASGGTVQISLTPGGAPVSVTTSGSGSAFVRLASPPLAGVIGNALSDTGYLSNIRGALKLAKSAGATVSQPLIDDLTARAGTINYNDSPKYNFAAV